MKKESEINFKIPTPIIFVMQELEKAGFEAYIVGGCVRDLLMENPSIIKPKDWDITTNANPKEIQKIFPDSVYENNFGTIGIKIKKTDEKGIETIEIIEVTTYRIETSYSDKRHPDKIEFAKTIEADLSRRDFTINALAFTIKNGKNSEIIDLYDGKIDLKNKLIRTVGNANERFNEDALRMMRAIRFSVTLGFTIEEKTLEAIKKNAQNLSYISAERIRDELIKIILSPCPARGIELLQKTGILKIIIPEIETGIDVMQSHHHYYGPYNTVYKHLLASLEKCPSEKLEVRLASLFHDIGKPQSKKGIGENATFYNHEYISEHLTKNILNRLHFSRNILDKTTLLVRNHMFYYNVDEVGEAGVRRIIHKIGLENINDLIDVRIADRLGSGVPKAVPYKLRHFRFMVEKVSTDPISAKQLKINGNDLMHELNIEPGPKVGAILSALLLTVIDNPYLNKKEELLLLAKALSEKNLIALRKEAEEKIKLEQKKEEALIKQKHKVS